MTTTTDRKYILNAEILGAMDIDANGAFTGLEAADAIGQVDTELSSGINGANILSAINSAYAKAAGNNPGGPQHALQINNPDGTFSGSIRLLAQDSDSKVFVSHTGNYNLTGSSVISAGLSVAGAASLNSTLGVAGQADFAGLLNANAALTASSAVISADLAAGNTVVGSLASVGAASMQSTLDVTGDTSVSSFDSSGVTQLATGGGATSTGGALSSAGDFDVATDKFTVASANGNTEIAGTLDVTGDTSVSSFDSSGVTQLATGGGATSTGGALSSAGDFDVATDKFTVASATGNTAVAGTLGVTGESTLASATVSDLTSGRLVFAGTAGSLEDSANLEFGSDTLSVTGDISGSIGVVGASLDATGGNIYLAGTNAAGNPDRYRIGVVGGLLVVTEI